METTAFDLSAYRQRVGLDGEVAVDLAGLSRVHDAHIRAIAFENFDLLLGRGVSVQPAVVFDRLVTDRRGGYCFTSNPLLCEALRAMGFDARVRSARADAAEDARAGAGGAWWADVSGGCGVWSTHAARGDAGRGRG